MLSILTLNIQAAAPERAQRLLTWLDSRDDAVIILTETSNGPGTAQLLARCRSAGLTVIHRQSDDGDRGCAIVSRLPMTPRPDLSADLPLPWRVAAGTVPTDPATTVLGLYVPSSDRAFDKVAKKRDFLASVAAMLNRLTDRERQHLIVGGDYNVITRDHQPRHTGFLPFEYEFLDALAQLGLTDMHAHLHPGVQAHSWIGRAGAGYRFDYLHAGQGLLSHLTGCDYLHEPRVQRLSDHAAVAATLQLDATVGTAGGALAEEAMTLF